MPLRDLSEISRGEGGGGNFKFGFGKEVTHPCNESEICYYESSNLFFVMPYTYILDDSIKSPTLILTADHSQVFFDLDQTQGGWGKLCKRPRRLFKNRQF